MSSHEDRTGMSALRRASNIQASTRPDHLLIAEMVAKGARVLDVGCGDGALLQLLGEEKGVDARGIEIEREKVNACVARGLSVIQGDADNDLADYPDDAFDYAILSLTIQATRRPKTVLENLLRIGRRAIVSFPNFGHWKVRGGLLINGRMPVTDNLPESWYETPNAHLCTIYDFADLVKSIEAEVEDAFSFNARGKRLGIKQSIWLQNLLGEKAVFLLKRR
ncbi:MAG: methionine biosynthesis protein MetW [Hyphomicrobiaceae bacterium]|nr:methionine biosynthesis protein MetW [Hyphomicrobiaceae bacterium]MCC0010700.1 methionine biosynthesis protein MetW [Hyphomicrobiaceae bacterium]